MSYVTQSLWNTRAPTDEEYAALLKAKSETDAHFRRGVIKSAWVPFGGNRLAWVKRCDVFGYCCGVGTANPLGYPKNLSEKWWIDFPDRRGRVEKKEPIFLKRIRRIHHHRLPDLHTWR